MAKAKTSAPKKWLDVRMGAGQYALIGPAKTIVAWDGSKPTGPVELRFTYWAPLVDALPAHLRPRADGPQHVLKLDSEAAVKSTIKELTAWLLARDPETKAKRQKTTTVFKYEGSHVLVDALPVTTADLALAEIGDREVGTIEVGGDQALYWRVGTFSLRARATADEIVFVDGDAPLPIDVAFEGGTAHGTWKFDELLVASWLPASITQFKGIASADASELVAFAGKSLKATTNDIYGSVTVAAARGTFRAETGTTGDARWCRFVRAG